MGQLMSQLLGFEAPVPGYPSIVFAFFWYLERCSYLRNLGALISVSRPAATMAVPSQAETVPVELWKATCMGVCP